MLSVSFFLDEDDYTCSVTVQYLVLNRLITDQQDVLVHPQRINGSKLIPYIIVIHVEKCSKNDL